MADRDALLRALGELAALRRRPGDKEEKKRVLKWLRGLSTEELLSLSCVEDPGFVKTLLHMGALSRVPLGTLQEFQLLPMTGIGSVIGQSKRQGKIQAKSSPREFVKRPLVRTQDGDVVAGFYSREYEECSRRVLRGMRVLNTLRSCDTVALGMAFFDKKGGENAAEFFRAMEILSRGRFLTESPSDSMCQVWGETKWLTEQGYYSVQALFVNQIELNIWTAWKQYTKAGNSGDRVPMKGLASKLYLLRELEAASDKQQRGLIKALGAKAVAHLRDLQRSTRNQAGDASGFQAARASLETLTSVLTAYQQTEHLDKCSKGRKLSVDTCFTCPFEDAVTSAHVAVMKLLLAEHLQGQCSLLLSERLAKEEDEVSTNACVSSREESPLGNKVKPKGSNHSQRRRASRKKMLKQRQRENSIRAAHQARLSEVLLELGDHFRRARKQALTAVEEVLRGVIVSAVDEAKPIPGGWSFNSEHSTNENSRSKKNKKKRKPKKKRTNGIQIGPDILREGDVPIRQASASGSMLFKKQSHLENIVENEKGERSAATAGSDSSPSQDERPGLLSSSSGTESVHGDSPRLSFFSNVGSSSTAASSAPSTLQLPAFSSHSLYSSGTTPFFLSLAPRDHHPPAPRATHRGSEDRDDDGNQLPEETAGSNAHEASESSNFEWYLPSVFSLQSSVHRTMSPSPTLDWHFNHWQFKGSDGGTSDKGNPATAPVTAGLDAPPPPSSSSSTSSASSRFANSKMQTSGSTRKYSLASFSKMVGLEAGRRGSSQGLAKQSLTAASAQVHGDGGTEPIECDTESDFLYREGGFFDRQRALKRRRRPWPFNYTHEEDEEEMTEEHDSRPRRCLATKDDSWTECVHCCKCECHRAAGVENNADFSGENAEGSLDGHGHCGHKQEHEAKDMLAAVDKVGNDVLDKVTGALERISQLEEKLAEKTKKMDEQAASASAEVASLKQTVSTLVAQLQNVEHDMQELQLQQASTNTGGDSSLGNVSSCSSPPAPFSPAPSSLDQQVESPPTAAPPLPDAYATTTSAMGPFVSVPLSVLPPRSKLHWDLCEFAAQLQADSDAQLPAQLAAQRLCTATVQSLWPRAQVRPYGSHVTRLVLPSSDVDLVICLPKVRRDAPADAAGVLEGRNAIKETWQQNLARKLRQEPWVVRDSVKTLPHAAVPIITLLTTPPYNVRLDISFEGPGHNGLATNDVVLSLLHEFPPLAPMMLVLKSFAIERGLAVAYSGGLSSYALLLLVARYLQEHSDTMPNGFANASRAVQHSLSSAQAGVADFGLMLMGFLDFYGNRFDPRTTGISVASRCFLNRESTFLGGNAADPHQAHQPSPYQQQYAADDAAVDDRTSQYGYAQHWQMPMQPHVQPYNPNVEAANVQGLRRYGYRSSLDLPASRALDGVGAAATGILDYQQLQQQTYDPHKFDPVFIEDPLCPSNNVGRNCFRIMQIRRAFSAAHLALLAASRDPGVFADNRMGLVAGVGLHPDNILRSILGPGAPVNAKPDAATSATVGVTSYLGGVEQTYPFYSQQQQQYAYHHHHHHQSQQSYHHVSVPSSRNGNASRNESSSRRHSESESEKLTTRSVASATSQNEHLRKKRVGSPQLTAHHHSDESEPPLLVQRTRHRHGHQPQRQSSLKQIDTHCIKPTLSRKSSERSLSFADVVRDGGNTGIASAGFHKTSQTSPLALARPPRFSRDDMALEESVNERWEIKDDSDLK